MMHEKLVELLLWVDDGQPSDSVVQFLWKQMFAGGVGGPASGAGAAPPASEEAGDEKTIRSKIMSDALLRVLPLYAEQTAGATLDKLVEVVDATPSNASILAGGPLWEQLPNTHLPSNSLLQLINVVGAHTFTDNNARRLLALLFTTSHCMLLSQYLMLVKGVLSLGGGGASDQPEMTVFSNTDPSRPGITCPPRAFPDKGFCFTARVFAVTLQNEPRLFSYGVAGNAWVECYLTYDGLVLLTKKSDKATQVRIRCTTPLKEWVRITVGLQYRYIGSSLLTLWVNGKQAGHASVKYPVAPKQSVSGDQNPPCLRLFGAVSEREGRAKHGFRGLWGSVAVYREYPASEALAEDKDGHIAQSLWHWFAPHAVHGSVVLDYEHLVLEHASRMLQNGERSGGCTVHTFHDPLASLQRVGGASVFVLFLKRFTALKITEETDLASVRDCVITTIEIICSLCKRDREELLACNGFGLISLVLKTLPPSLLSNHLVKVLMGLLSDDYEPVVWFAVLHDLLIGVCGIRLWKASAFDTQKMLYVRVLEFLNARTARLDPADAVAYVADVEEEVIPARDLLRCILSLFYDTKRDQEVNANAHLTASQLGELRVYLTDILWWMFAKRDGHPGHLAVLIDALDAAEKDGQQLHDVLVLLLRFFQLPNALTTLQQGGRTLVPWLARYLSHPDMNIRMLSVKLYMAEGGKTRYEPLIAVARGLCSPQIYATLKEAAMGRVTSCATLDDAQWSDIRHHDLLEPLVTAVCGTTLLPAVQRRIQNDLAAGLKANPQAVVWMVNNLPTGLLVFNLARLGNNMTPLLGLLCRSALTSPQGVRFLEDVWTCLVNLPTFGSAELNAAVAAAVMVLHSGAVAADPASSSVVPTEPAGGSPGCADPAVVMLDVCAMLLEEILAIFNQGDVFPSRYALDAYGKVAQLTREILTAHNHRTDPEYSRAASSCTELCVKAFMAAATAKIDLSQTMGNLAPPPSLQTVSFSPSAGQVQVPRGKPGSLLYRVLLSLTLANLSDFLRRLSAATVRGSGGGARGVGGGATRGAGGSFGRKRESGTAADGHQRLQELALRLREIGSGVVTTMVRSFASSEHAAGAAAPPAPTHANTPQAGMQYAVPPAGTPVSPLAVGGMGCVLADYLDSKLVEMRGRLDTQLSQADSYVDSVITLLAKNIDSKPNHEPLYVRTVLCVATYSMSLVADADGSEAGAAWGSSGNLGGEGHADPVYAVLLRLVARTKNVGSEELFTHVDDDPLKWDQVRNSDNAVAAEAFEKNLAESMPKPQKRLQSILEDLDAYTKQQDDRVSAFHADTAASMLELAECRASGSRGGGAGSAWLGTPLPPSQARSTRGFHLDDSDFDPSFGLHADWATMEKRVRDTTVLQWWRDARYALATPVLSTDASADAGGGGAADVHTLPGVRQLKERIFWKVDPGCRGRLKRWRPKGVHAGVGDYRKKIHNPHAAGGGAAVADIAADPPADGSPARAPMTSDEQEQLQEMVQQSAALTRSAWTKDSSSNNPGEAEAAGAGGDATRGDAVSADNAGGDASDDLERLLDFDGVENAAAGEGSPCMPSSSTPTPGVSPTEAQHADPASTMSVPAAAAAATTGPPPPRSESPPDVDTDEEGGGGGGGDAVGSANAALMGANERIQKDTNAAQVLRQYHAWFVAPMELKEGRLDLTTTQLFFTAQVEGTDGGAVDGDGRRRSVLDASLVGTNRPAPTLRTPPQQCVGAAPPSPAAAPQPQQELAHSAVFCKDIVVDIPNIAAIYPRNYYLRPIALEICVDGDTRSLKTYMFKFASKKMRDDFLHRIRALKDVISIKHGPALSTRTPAELVKDLKITDRWCRGQLSNYEYLLELNLLAGRTFRDVDQYPVFPWVLSDYTSATIDLSDPAVYRDLSKPIGALNPTRLESFKARYEGMPDGDIPKFHYGTHYSSGGAVLFYLTRLEPFATMLLTLQDGKWDHCDRMFHSIATTWRGVLEGPADVKELIPEFYTCPEMLLNTNRFNFGELSSGETMDDVVLPPWARDAHHFITTNRRALESAHVSAHLHKWIELVFGHAQRGKEAVKAHNVFFHLTYEGAVNWDAVSEADAPGLQQQIQFFGQTPSQLFTRPHPAKRVPEESAAKQLESLLPIPIGAIGAIAKPNIPSLGGLLGPRDSTESVLAKLAGCVGDANTRVVAATSVVAGGGSGGGVSDVLAGVFFAESSAANAPLVMMAIYKNLQTTTFKWDAGKHKVSTSSRTGGRTNHTITLAPNGIGPALAPRTDTNAAATTAIPYTAVGANAPLLCDTVFEAAAGYFTPGSRLAMTEGGHLIMAGFYDGAVRVSLCRKHATVADFAPPTLFTTANFGLATVVCTSKQFVAVGTSHGLVCVFVWRPPANYLPQGNRPVLARMLRGHAGPVTAVAADSALDTLVSAARGTILVHSLRKGRLIRMIPMPSETLHVRRVLVVDSPTKLAFPIIAVLSDTARKRGGGTAVGNRPAPPDADELTDAAPLAAVTVFTLNADVVFSKLIGSRFRGKDMTVVCAPAVHVVVGGRCGDEGRVYVFNVFREHLLVMPGEGAAPAAGLVGSFLNMEASTTSSGAGSAGGTASHVHLDYEEVVQAFPVPVTTVFTPPIGAGADAAYFVGTAAGQVYTVAVDKGVVHPNTVVKAGGDANVSPHGGGKRSPKWW